MQNRTVQKSEIRNYVLEIIAGKIKKLEDFIEFTIDASRDIKKTPKYDSIREEIQEEIYQMQRQLGSLNDLQRHMVKVLNAPTDTVQLGSMVFTNKARFYISVSLGEFFYEGDRFYAISEQSPMAQVMFGKVAGDSFVLNNISQTIQNVM
ncbi:hypothetical protein CO230_02605 [Chryseobacterium sp. 6424]|uniref:hypothetical protein n=1 Tax=Chryseobacterium sp. 6424 TaxID=2039166 RepID=UPI000EFB4BDA|nr:hypothetical protein [Chryseobacterium sp. 6424]AYO57113.1 hypothetical protein CO230_02605 [Chryseobacterium sp. 6424]